MNKFLNVTAVVGGAHLPFILNCANIVSISADPKNSDVTNVSFPDGKAIQVTASLAWFQSQLPQ